MKRKKLRELEADGGGRPFGDSTNTHRCNIVLKQRAVTTIRCASARCSPVSALTKRASSCHRRPQRWGKDTRTTRPTPARKPDLLIPTNRATISTSPPSTPRRRTGKAMGTARSSSSATTAILDKVVNNIWEMSRSGVENLIAARYSHYVTQREERWSLRQTVMTMQAIPQGTRLHQAQYRPRFDQRYGCRQAQTPHSSGQNGAIAGPIRCKWTEQAKASAQWGISKAKWEVPDVEPDDSSAAAPGPTDRRKTNLNLHARPSQRQYRHTHNRFESAIQAACRLLTILKLPSGSRRPDWPHGTGQRPFKTILKRIDPLAGVIPRSAPA